MSIDKITINGNSYIRQELNKPECKQCDILKDQHKELRAICTFCVRVNPENTIYKKTNKNEKTFVQLLRDLGKWKPEKKSTTSEEECLMLKQHFGMDSMDKLELRNLRDACVNFYHAKLVENNEDFDALQAMMSITAVIDIQTTLLNL